MNYINHCIFLLCFVFGIATLLSCDDQKFSNQVEKLTAISDSKNIQPDPLVKMSDSIMVVYQDKRDIYWFGSNGRGVYQFDGKNLKQHTKKDGLCSNNIIGIQEDKFGNVFFDSPDGVSKYDGNAFTTLKVIVDIDSKNEWKTSPDDLWFRMGWNSGGPFRYDGENLYYLEFPANAQEAKFSAVNPNVPYNPYGVYYIYKDRQGVLWFGTSNLGIYRYDGNNISWMYEQQLTETPQGGSFGIRSILEDKDGYFWICNSNYKYNFFPNDAKGNKFYPLQYKRQIGIENKDSDSEYYLSMVSDDDGKIWMVTYNNGVWSNNGKELMHYPIKNGEKDVFLFSIYKDNHGVLWLGTHNDGVYKFTGTRFEKFIIN